MNRPGYLPYWMNRPLYGLNNIVILLGRFVHFIDLIYSSFLDEPSTLWTWSIHPSRTIRPHYGLELFMILPLYGLKLFILLGWSVHFMDLINFSSFLDDPSTLWTWSIHPFWMIRPLYGLELFILLGWSIHFMDLINFSSFLDDPSTLWTWSIHPFWMIRPFYGLDKFCIKRHFSRIWIFLVFIKPKVVLKGEV